MERANAFDAQLLSFKGISNIDYYAPGPPHCWRRGRHAPPHLCGRGPVERQLYLNIPFVAYFLKTSQPYLTAPFMA